MVTLVLILRRANREIQDRLRNKALAKPISPKRYTKKYAGHLRCCGTYFSCATFSGSR